MPATPGTRLPEPTDSTLYGWVDASRVQRIAVARRSVTAILPSNGWRPVVTPDPENPAAFNITQEAVYTAMGMTANGQAGAMILLFEDPVESVRDAWIADNAATWLDPA